MLEANKFGRYNKKQILDNGYRILNEDEQNDRYTATYIKEMLGIKLTPEQRLRHNKGFICNKGWYGCVPSFDLKEIMDKSLKGEL